MFSCFKCGQYGNKSYDYPKRYFQPQANLIDLEGIVYDNQEELDPELLELERDEDPAYQEQRLVEIRMVISLIDDCS